MEPHYNQPGGQPQWDSTIGPFLARVSLEKHEFIYPALDELPHSGPDLIIKIKRKILL